MNERIRLSPIFLIDENGTQVGEVDTRDALRRAQELGVDLVEVNPNRRPPVCKLMDYGKFRYEQSKKVTNQRAHESKLKELRLRPSTDEHDLQIKVNKAREFLEEGDKVQFTMMFRGRERVHQDLGAQNMRDIAEKLASISKVERVPRMDGRRMIMVLTPGKAKDVPLPLGPVPSTGSPGGPLSERLRVPMPGGPGPGPGPGPGGPRGPMPGPGPRPPTSPRGPMPGPGPRGPMPGPAAASQPPPAGPPHGPRP